jgi:hypothetical protein
MSTNNLPIPAMTNLLKGILKDSDIQKSYYTRVCRHSYFLSPCQIIHICSQWFIIYYGKTESYRRCRVAAMCHCTLWIKLHMMIIIFWEMTPCGCDNHHSHRRGNLKSYKAAYLHEVRFVATQNFANLHSVVLLSTQNFVSPFCCYYWW